MSRVTQAANTVLEGLGLLTQSIVELTVQQGRSATAMAEVAREQRITNLIVRSQISSDPAEKSRLLQEAARRMDNPRRRTPDDDLIQQPTSPRRGFPAGSA